MSVTLYAEKPLTSFDGNESMDKVAEYQADDRGALLMSWTSWLQQNHPGQATSTSLYVPSSGKPLKLPIAWYDGWLAVGSATGQIKILRITIASDSTVTVAEQHACLASPKTVTLLKWLKTGQLIVGRLSEITVWSPAAMHTLKLPIENYKGWPSVPNPIEVLHMTMEDRLVVALSDGTFRTIDAVLSASPQVWTLDKAAIGPALQITDRSRRALLAVERAAAKNKASITPATAMLLSGCPALDESGTVMLSYERHYNDVKTFQAALYHKQGGMVGRLGIAASEESNEQIAQRIGREIHNLIDVHEMCEYTLTN